MFHDYTSVHGNITGEKYTLPVYLIIACIY